ncbi:MAG TPA: SH3 domain-containing protein [Chitinophagaceae bacterium]|nr:SH3 domain-containing protein [Chitinophagaceae bacterium]
MSLQEKYKQLIDAATTSGMNVREQDNVLYINGEATNGATKDNLWNIYGQIDPDFRGSDVVMDVNVNDTMAGSKVKVNTDKSNLNIRKGPGTDQPIVGKAAKDEMITLISKTNDQWWLVRTDAGEEGYAYAEYLNS